MNRRVVVALWGVLIVTGLSLYWVYFADSLDTTLTALQDLATEHYLWVAITYVLFLAIRGLTLMPSTPLLFAGILLFPDWLAYTLNMAGIIVSSWLVILAIQYTGFGARLDRLRSPRVARMEERLQAHGAPIIVTWSFFPLVPTDLIVYIATLLRFSKRTILAAVMAGEATLNAIYVFGGSAVVRNLLT